MKNLLLILFITCFSTGFAQNKSFTVLGIVTDNTTGLPLAGASVFCQNTTQGTITNNDGLFYMRLSNGGYDLVVTYTGFDKVVMRISNMTITDTIFIELAPENRTMEEVAVVASTEDPNGLEKYGQFFTRHFIGTTPNAAGCVIENPEALRFFFSKKRNRLKVTAKNNIIINNYALGYRIRYQLDSFSYDYGTMISQYTGSPLFQELDSTEEVMAQWKKNRAYTYLGSRLHFMRALYDSIVTQEGFAIELVKDTGYIEVVDIYNDNYYEADSSEVSVDWMGRFRILYKSVAPDPKFLQEYKLNKHSSYQATLLDIPDGFTIEQNGYFYDQYEIINTGYWAWKKLAELLPYDYDYEVD